MADEMHFSGPSSLTRSTSIGLLIMIMNIFLTRTRPGKQIYLINQIAFSHPASNNMVYVSTLLCPRRLFSPSIGSWLWWPRPRQATRLALFQPPGVYKEPEMGQIIGLTPAAASTTPLQDLPSPPPLLLLLDVPFPDLKSSFLCRIALVHQDDRSSCTRKSTSPLKNVLANAPLTFTRNSTSPLKNMLANAPLTFTRKLSHSQASARKCTVDFHSQVNQLSRTCSQMHC